jgi:hypothetical protein
MTTKTFALLALLMLTASSSAHASVCDEWRSLAEQAKASGRIEQATKFYERATSCTKDDLANMREEREEFNRKLR